MSIKPAGITKIPIGNMTIDGLITADGTFYIGIPQIAEQFQLDKNQASREFKRLMGENYHFIKLKTLFNSQAVKAMTIDDFYKLSLILYNKNPNRSRLDICTAIAKYLGKDIELLKILHSFNLKNGEKEGQERERNLQLTYLSRLGGKIEVTTPVGRVDLVTDDSLYEFKNWKGFKEALGQVLSYKRYIKVKNYYIVLFNCPENFKNNPLYTEMLSICENYNITLRTVD